MTEAVVEGFRLSHQQAAVWRVRHGGPDARVECLVEVRGALDDTLLHRALETVAARHEILRTGFRRLAGMKLPLQVVEESARVDLARQGGLLHLSVPALNADPWTMVALVDELSRAYTTAHNGETGEYRGATGAGGPPGVAYSQYAEWQHALLAEDGAGEARAYWHGLTVDPVGGGRLAGLRPGPLGVPAPPDGGVDVPSEVVAALDRLAGRLGVEASSVLLAAWACLVARAAGTTAVTVTTLVDGRLFGELEGALGPFATAVAVPLRWEPDGPPPFAEAVRAVARALRAHDEWLAYAPAYAPSGAGATGEPLAAFEYLEHPVVFQAGDARLSLGWVRQPLPPGGVRLRCQRAGAGLRLALDTDGGDGDTDGGDGAWLLELLLTLLEAGVRRPATAVERLPLLRPPRQREVATALARVPAPRDTGDATWAGLFAAQVAATPGAVAVYHAGGALSYAELDARASALRARLGSMGIGPETPVGLCAERGPGALAGIVAILQAGAVYVPLDAGDPPGRLAFVLADAGAKALLADERAGARLARVGVPVVPLDGGTGTSQDAATVAGAAAARPAAGGNAAYVMYTSGSTGPPKGVVVEQRSLVRYLRWTNEELLDGLLVPATTRLTFDASLKQLLAPLLRGAAVWLVGDATVTDLPALYRALCDPPHGAGDAGAPVAFNCVPSLWQSLLELVAGDTRRSLRPHLRRLLLGGEAVPADLLAGTREHLPGIEVVNLYGPTEATANASAARLDTPGAVTIGRPLPGAEILVLDRDHNPVPPGVAGGLFIGGAGLARGYLGRAGETAQRFVPHPLAEVPGRRLYDSGDLARWAPDGSIEFLGRSDLQVKIRGVRIELQAVEAALLDVDGVAEAAAGLRELSTGGRQLVAFVVAAPGVELPAGELRRRLAERLPEPMIPARVASLPALPRTPAGKLDRRALADVEVGSDTAPEPSSTPRSIIEEELLGTWAQLLERSDVALDDTFFELGGHSLLVVRLMSRVAERFGVELPPRTVFEVPTVRRFAARLDEAIKAGSAPPGRPLEPVPRDGALPLSFAQQGLWVHHQFEPSSSRYNVLGTRAITGEVDVAVVRRSLEDLVRRHEVLRTGFASVRGVPRAVVADHAGVPFEVVDLREVPAAGRDADLARHVDRLVEQPFDLTRPPLLRVALLRLTDREWVIAAVLHHIVCDGWAKGVLFGDFAAFYRARSTGAEPGLGPLPVQYADYAVWERERLRDEELDRHLAYWRAQLDGLRPLELPCDHSRPGERSYRGGNVDRVLEPGLAGALRRLAVQEGATVFMTTLAAFDLLLSRCARQDDVAVAIPVAGRRHVALEALVGSFVNTVVLRTGVVWDGTFADLLARTRAVALEAYAHQDVPFEKVVEALRPHRSWSRSPLSEVMFAVVPPPPPPVPLAGDAVLRPLDVAPATALYDLTLTLVDSGEEPVLSFNYDAELFLPETVAGWLDGLVTLLARATAAPTARLPDLAGDLFP